VLVIALLRGRRGPPRTAAAGNAPLWDGCTGSRLDAPGGRVTGFGTCGGFSEPPASVDRVHR